MTGRKRLTKTLVGNLQPGEIIWDAEVRGFAVRCQRRDRVYVVKYRYQGRQRWYTIGKHGSPWTVERARTEAKRVLGLVADKKDPSAEKRTARTALTLGEVASDFISKHVEVRSKPRTQSEYRRLIEKVIKPELGRQKLDHVTPADISKLHYKFRSTPYQANRILALLSKIFNWAGHRGERNPCIGIARYAEQKRRRYLSTAELARLGVALHDFESSWNKAQEIRSQLDDQRSQLEAASRLNKRRDIRFINHVMSELRRELESLGELVSIYAVVAVRLLIFTGARLSEILTLRWEHVDFERSCLNLADSKTGPKTIHLNAPALDLLTNLSRLEGNPYVIPGERRHSHLVNLEKPWRRLRKRAGLSDVRLHDLRHSFASVGAGAGLGLPIIGALLGHTQAATTARYAHLADDPLRQASDIIGARIAAVMGGGEPGTVVPMAKRKA
jgi:integrase